MIRPNAAPDELDSPFFIKNESICKRWEELSMNNNGNCTGTYNSWSYKLRLEIPKNKKWEITISQAIYSSGNLLLSSKYQSVQTTVELKTTIPYSTKFIIRKSKFRAIFACLKPSNLPSNHRYALFGTVDKQIRRQLLDHLQLSFKDRRIFRITGDQGILTIVLHNSNEAFSEVQSLLNNWKDTTPD